MVGGGLICNLMYSIEVMPRLSNSYMWHDLTSLFRTPKGGKVVMWTCDSPLLQIRFMH